jgi:uncharacterized protein (DUF4415 family)
MKPIPHFKSEKEERDFWETHDTCDYIDWSKAKRVTFPNLQKTDFSKLSFENTQKRVSLTLDSDIIARFKATGKGWQSRINQALREASPQLTP